MSYPPKDRWTRWRTIHEALCRRCQSEHAADLARGAAPSVGERMMEKMERAREVEPKMLRVLSFWLIEHETGQIGAQVARRCE